MKNILWVLIFLLPLHAFIITVLKCKYWIDTNLLRFWKEIIILFVCLYLFFVEYAKNDWSLKKLFHKNTLLWLTTAFIVCSAIYIFFPFFEIKTASVLGFRYDVFFLFAMIIGLYCGLIWEIRFFLKTLFISTFGILIVFLPWFLFWNIENMANIFWYSSEVSTYTANACISFAQNVEGGHARFQATFGGPIQMSVFLTIVGTLFMGWILSSARFAGKQRNLMIAWFMLLLLPAIFFSYSKTSMLWVVFAASMFILLTYKYIYQKKITRKFYGILAAIFITPIAVVALVKWELFLHLWAIVNRLDNLKTSMEMFFYNPFGYGLGIAGPASQIGNSIESAWNWQIAAASVLSVHRFLPENWYVQIALEQWIVWVSLFITLIIFIGYRLIARIKKHRDYLSIGIATAYFALCFMALFTHAFEEAATSYILFFFIGLVLAESMSQEKHAK